MKANPSAPEGLTRKDRLLAAGGHGSRQTGTSYFVPFSGDAMRAGK
jgi:hypothetical protein